LRNGWSLSYKENYTEKIFTIRVKSFIAGMITGAGVTKNKLRGF
jgi:hypothetical protein